ncbi:MAG TPA: ABC transporter permease [Acidimicrobiia bacterium]|nr:ABC transporter permease [Acidimicrobiia bacterium]
MAVSAPRGITYRARRLRTYLTDLWGRREFAWFLAMGNLKARNASTALGLIWWVLNPLLLGLVYFFVFGVLFAGSSRPDDYIAYLLSGMFVFHFTNQSMTGGANAILQNAKLLANLKFPRMVLLISALIESIVGFLASLLVFYAISWLTVDIHPTTSTLLLIVIIPIQILFNLGLSAIVARMAVPFRDINNFLPYVNRLWLYLSPIIWSLSFLEDADPALKTLVELNPMFHIIGLYRAALIGNVDYPLVDYPLVTSDLLISLAWAVGIFVIGVAGFIRYETRMVRYL